MEALAYLSLLHSIAYGVGTLLTVVGIYSLSDGASRFASHYGCENNTEIHHDCFALQILAGLDLENCNAFNALPSASSNFSSKNGIDLDTIIQHFVRPRASLT